MIGGADKTLDLDLILSGKYIQLDHVGNDEKRGQNQDASQKKPDSAAQSAERLHALHPVLVKLNIVNPRHPLYLIDKIPGVLRGHDIFSQCDLKRGRKGIGL